MKGSREVEHHRLGRISPRQHSLLNSDAAFYKDELDNAPVGKEPYKTPVCHSTKEILAEFDKNVTAARSAIVAAPDGDFIKLWPGQVEMCLLLSSAFTSEVKLPGLGQAG